MKNSLIILGFFVLGVTLGYANYVPEYLVENDISMYALYLLMLLAGVGIGSDKSSLDVVRKVSLKVLLVPTVVVVGSLLGVAVIALLVPGFQLKEALAVGAGFGYYSLSSIFITQISGETWGVIALLSNILREIITLLGGPLMARYFGKLAPIASGGATAMDTTLPIIVHSSGKQYAMIAVFSGVVLTIIVPFLVTFILEVF